jgi:uncharacterized protein YfaT (DUF1175 family)
VKPALALALAALALCAGGLVLLSRTPASAPQLSLEPASLLADGYDSATLSILDSSSAAPRIALDNPHAATVDDPVRSATGWEARVRAGVTPGVFTIRVGASVARLQLRPFNADSASDGTPDYLRLDDPRDRRAFRRWFTFLAEAQYFQPAEARPAEIADCAALIRYAYREALRAHDSAWATSAHLPLTPAFDSVAKYQYPHTPLGANLFLVRPATFAQFADAQTLERLNTHFVSRDLGRALPGDLLFFRQDSDHMPFHSMIFVGPSQLVEDPGPFVVYHTGPDDDGPGVIRRLSAAELLHYPEPDWRPVAANPYFLGVYRWNILKDLL